MKLQWTRAAVGDLAEIRNTIELDRPEVAEGIAKLILESVSRIRQYPDVGKIGRMKGTHELVVPRSPYVLVYRRFRTSVQILRVLHGRRKWPNRSRR